MIVTFLGCWTDPRISKLSRKELIVGRLLAKGWYPGSVRPLGGNVAVSAAPNGTITGVILLFFF